MRIIALIISFVFCGCSSIFIRTLVIENVEYIEFYPTNEYRIAGKSVGTWSKKRNIITLKSFSSPNKIELSEIHSLQRDTCDVAVISAKHKFTGVSPWKSTLYFIKGSETIDSIKINVEEPILKINKNRIKSTSVYAVIPRSYIYQDEYFFSDTIEFTIRDTIEFIIDFRESFNNQIYYDNQNFIKVKKRLIKQ